MSSIWWLNEMCWIWLSLGKIFFWPYMKVQSECTAYWSMDDSMWKRFIQACYMIHFSILCNTLLNKTCGGKKKSLPKCYFPSRNLCLEERSVLLGMNLWQGFYYLRGRTLGIRTSSNKTGFLIIWRWKHCRWLPYELITKIAFWATKHLWFCILTSSLDLGFVQREAWSHEGWLWVHFHTM